MYVHMLMCKCKYVYRILITSIECQPILGMLPPTLANHTLGYCALY